MQHNEIEKFDHEIYNRCSLHPFGKYEKYQFYSKYLYLHERNLLTTISHKYKKNINIDEVRLRRERLKKQLGDFTVSYVAVLRNIDDKYLRHLKQFSHGQIDVDPGDVIIGVNDPFVFMTHTFLFGLIYTSHLRKFGMIINRFLFMYRIVTVADKPNSYDTIIRTDTTPLYIDYYRTRLTMSALIVNHKNKINKYKLATIFKIRDFIKMNFAGEGDLNKHNYDFM